MEEVQADALAAGVDPEAVDCSAECAMFEALAAAYAERFGPEEEPAPVEEAGQGAPEANQEEPPAGEPEAAAAEAEPVPVAEAPADELTPRRRARQREGSHPNKGTDRKGNGAAA
jgi:hypothetical protein